MNRNAETISTDTATICIFDPAAMRHRKDDVGDWWSIPANELAEVRACNALFLNMGSDGTYDVEVVRTHVSATDGFCLNTPSLRVYIGPGEEMSGGGFEPTGEWGGFFIPVEHPHQKVSVVRDGSRLTVGLVQTAPSRNQVDDLVRI